MARRRANGEGTIYRRKDGRYEGAAYFLTTAGTRKRIRVYAKTREQVHARLTATMARAERGVPVPSEVPSVAAYLKYWLSEVVGPNRRPATYERYELAVRVYLTPGLGTYRLTQLSVPIVQAFLNQQLADGRSIRNVQIMREVLSSALSRAMREEILTRNVARLVELPKWESPEIKPWTAGEARAFVAGARQDPLYAAFLLLVLYGLRRGEVLGLRWCDVDFEASTLHIQQQVQRVGGALRQGPVKTAAGRRNLPLLMAARTALLVHRPQGEGDQLVFRTRTGLPIEPRNFVRSFQRICRASDVRLIRVHDVRHTSATFLKNCQVPARDAQLILGHSSVQVTQQIYQHDDMNSRRRSLEQVEALFLRVHNRERCRQILPSSLTLSTKLRQLHLAGETGLEPATPGFGARNWPPEASGLTEALVVLRACVVQWLLGRVAVKNSRQVLPIQPVRRPHELWSLTSRWLGPEEGQ